MAELQEWFKPLLWIIGTITAIVAFVKLVLPLFKNFAKPAKLEQALDEHIANISDKLDHFDERLDLVDDRFDDLVNKINRNEEVELALLHDAIVQIYHFSKSRGSVYAEDYLRACELYKYNGKSQYIETIMEELTELYKSNMGTSRGDKE